MDDLQRLRSADLELFVAEVGDDFEEASEGGDAGSGRAALDVLATDCLDVLVADVGPAHGARLEVDDAGPGVSALQGQQVFEWFTRGARAGHRSDDTASGLGLALVDQHLSRHGGAVWVKDSPSAGARFVVELPELQR